MATSKKSATAEMLRKITVKDVLGEPVKDLLPESGESIQLMVVYGYATGNKVKETSYGAAEALTGWFEAVRTADGAIFSSAVAYLPEPLGSTVLAAVKTRENPEMRIEFAAAIGIKGSKKSAVGYEYWCKPYQKPEERDALANLRTSVAGLLEAPK